MMMGRHAKTFLFTGKSPDSIEIKCGRFAHGEPNELKIMGMQANTALQTTWIHEYFTRNYILNPYSGKLYHLSSANWANANKHRHGGGSEHHINSFVRKILEGLNRTAASDEIEISWQLNEAYLIEHHSRTTISIIESAWMLKSTEFLRWKSRASLGTLICIHFFRTTRSIHTYTN